LVIKLALDDSIETKYMRKGNDLVYTHSLKLIEALTSAPVRFKTLDDREVSLNLDQLLTPQSIHKMAGEGMPITVEPTDPSELTNHLQPLSAIPKGDLYIKFDIHFPNNIAVEHKTKIVELLRKNAEETNS
jgi:DnaJ family protein B protein 4